LSAATGTAGLRIAHAHAERAARLPGGEAWRQRRAESLERLLACGLPTRRDESWKYADLRTIVAGAERACGAAAEDVRLPAAALDLPGLVPIVLVDGVWRGGPALPASVRVESIATALDGALCDPASLRRPGDEPQDRLALLADAYTGAGVVIHVDDALPPSTCLYLVHVTSGAGTHHARVVVSLGPNASARLLEHQLGPEAAAGFANLAVDVDVGAGARLWHGRIQEASARDCRVDTLHVRVARDARYEQHQFVLGGAASRVGLTVELAAPGAAARLDGLLLVDAGRRSDFDVLVRHSAPDTASEHVVRGVGAAAGQGAVGSCVYVAAGAQRTNSRQSLRNLLLAAGAEIDVRPQLEINADDVRCSHGATTGSLDPAQLFYLLSRGVDRAAAQALLTFAFCEDVLTNLPDAGLRRALEERVIARLPDRDVIREFI
jgi:Fe-S cluster assembly protein SufD